MHNPNFSDRAWPVNAWYVAARDVEVGRTLMPRTIAGKELVLFRRTDGKVAILDDACWHRLVPLSKGWLDGDRVVCGYHGLEFDPEGRCRHMPAQKTINPNARVRSYPVIEQDRFVWIWMGEPALADPAKVPDLHWNDNPNWTGDGELLHIGCNYRLIVDNLLDLTHETYVHGNSIGHISIVESPFEVTHSDHGVRVTRWMEGVEAPPFWAQQMEWRFGTRPDKVDRWQIIDFRTPGNFTLDVGVAVAGTGAREGDRSQGVNNVIMDLLTPETETSTHYFWSITRNYALRDLRISTLLRKSNGKVFDEDVHMLEAQQKAISAHPDKVFYDINIDAGAMHARRLIDHAIAREADLAGMEDA